MNEHEIEFAESVAQRGVEAFDAMDKYLIKIIRASYFYARACNIMYNNKFKFSIGEWTAKNRNTMYEVGTNRFFLKYKKIKLIDSMWWIKNKEVVVMHNDTFIDMDNLFYITEFVNTIGKTITEMSIMMSKVNT